MNKKGENLPILFLILFVFIFVVSCSTIPYEVNLEGVVPVIDEQETTTPSKETESYSEAEIPVVISDESAYCVEVIAASTNETPEEKEIKEVINEEPQLVLPGDELRDVLEDISFPVADTEDGLSKVTIESNQLEISQNESFVEPIKISIVSPDSNEESVVPGVNSEFVAPVDDSVEIPIVVVESCVPVSENDDSESEEGTFQFDFSGNITPEAADEYGIQPDR